MDTAYTKPQKSLLSRAVSYLQQNFIRAVGVIIILFIFWRIIYVAGQTSYTPQYWTSQLFNGLVLGGVYALIALGYTLVYGILFMINFAHGEVMMMGGFAGYFILQAMTAMGWADGSTWQSVLTIVVMMLGGMLVSILVAVLLERLAYRPLRSAPRLVPLISAIGASFFLQYSALIIFGALPHPYKKPTVISGILKFGDSGISITYTGLFIFITSIVLMIALQVIVRKTKMGRAMRSVAESKEIATLMGVNVDQVIVFTFVLGAALAGAGGVMFGLHNTIMRFNSGFIPGIKAFTAAVLGGIGNLPGAMFGALMLGLLEAFGPSALGMPTEYKDVIAFSVLVLVLIFRPTGLFGEVLSEKKA